MSEIRGHYSPFCVYLQERKRKAKLGELGSLDLLPFRQRKLFEVIFRAYSRVFIDMVKSRVSSCLVIGV